MTAPVPFDYSGQTVRTVEIDDEPWFVARDVCAVLGIRNVGNVLAALDEDEKSIIQIVDARGERDAPIVSESGLYSIILRCRKPEAKPFRRWVTGEVLPTIRRTGTYTVPNTEPPTTEVDPFDTLQGMLDRLRENRDMAVRALMGIADHEDRLIAHEDRLIAIESNPNWLTATGWAVLRGFTQSDVTTLGKIGKHAVRVAREAHLQESKVLDIHGRYYVNRWPAYVWDEAARRLQAEIG